MRWWEDQRGKGHVDLFLPRCASCGAATDPSPDVLPACLPAFPGGLPRLHWLPAAAECVPGAEMILFERPCRAPFGGPPTPTFTQSGQGCPQVRMLATMIPRSAFGCPMVASISLHCNLVFLSSAGSPELNGANSLQVPSIWECHGGGLWKRLLPPLQLPPPGEPLRLFPSSPGWRLAGNVGVHCRQQVAFLWPFQVGLSCIYFGGPFFFHAGLLQGFRNSQHIKTLSKDTS